MFKEFLTMWAGLLAALGGLVGVMYGIVWAGENLPGVAFMAVLLVLATGTIAAAVTFGD